MGHGLTYLKRSEKPNSQNQQRKSPSLSKHWAIAILSDFSCSSRGNRSSYTPPSLACSQKMWKKLVAWLATGTAAWLQKLRLARSERGVVEREWRETTRLASFHSFEFGTGFSSTFQPLPSFQFEFTVQSTFARDTIHVHCGSTLHQISFHLYRCILLGT